MSRARLAIVSLAGVVLLLPASLIVLTLFVVFGGIVIHVAGCDLSSPVECPPSVDGSALLWIAAHWELAWSTLKPLMLVWLGLIAVLALFVVGEHAVAFARWAADRLSARRNR